MPVVKINDHFSILDRAVLAMSRTTVLVGIPANSMRTSIKPGGVTSNSAVAYVQEFGAPDLNIPARPFLGPGIRDAQLEVVQTLRKAAVSALKDVAALKTTASGGGPIEQAMHSIGDICARAVVARIEGGAFEPLAEATLANRRKRGNTSTAPLLDTKQMRDAVTYRVVPKAGR